MTKELDAKGRDIQSKVKEVPEGVEICCWSTPVVYQAYDRTCNKNFNGHPVEGISITVVLCPDCGYEQSFIGGPGFDYWNDCFRWSRASTDSTPKKRQVHLVTGGHAWWEVSRCFIDSRIDEPEQYMPVSYYTRSAPTYRQEHVRAEQGERGRLRRIWKYMMQDLHEGNRREIEDFMMARVHDPKYFHLFVENDDHEEDIPDPYFYQHPKQEEADE